MLIMGTIIFVIVPNNYSRCNINLSDGTNNCNLSIDDNKILINEAGEYYFDGMTDQYSIEVTSNNDITFIFNNVIMENVETSFNILSNVDVSFIINEDTKIYGNIESLGNIHISGDGVLEINSDETNIKSEKNYLIMEEIMRFEPGVEVMWRDRKRWLGLPWTFTRYYLAKKEGEWVKLFRHKGLLSSVIDEVNIYRCFDLTLHASLADKIFGTGTIKVESNDSAMPDFYLMHIANPYKIRDLLSNLIEIERKKRRVGITEFQAPQE